MKFKFCGNIDCPDWLLSEIIYLTKISSVKLRILSNQACNYILTKGRNHPDLKKILEEMNFTSDEASIIISVLEFILKNAAKFDVDELALNQELLQLGLMQENADSISKVFKNQKIKLRDKLKDSVQFFNTIKGIEYKMSYVLSNQYSNFELVNNKENENINEDNYQISNLEKTKVNLLFNLHNGRDFNLIIDKEKLGQLINDLEKCSQSIKKYKEQG